jgi:hypothetical protein
VIDAGIAQAHGFGSHGKWIIRQAQLLIACGLPLPVTCDKLNKPLVLGQNFVGM